MKMRMLSAHTAIIAKAIYVKAAAQMTMKMLSTLTAIIAKHFKN